MSIDREGIDRAKAEAQASKERALGDQGLLASVDSTLAALRAARKVDHWAEKIAQNFRGLE